MTAPTEHLAALERTLDGAVLWGAELETRYRVLALTVEPAAGGGRGAQADDRRLQLLLSPVHTILGVLRERVEGGPLRILQFPVDRLVTVVGAFDGPTLSGPFLDLGEPGAGEWKPAEAAWSLEGRAQTVDGRAHDLRLSLRRGADGVQRALDLYATFDEVRVRTAAGEELDPGQLVP